MYLALSADLCSLGKAFVSHRVLSIKRGIDSTSYLFPSWHFSWTSVQAGAALNDAEVLSFGFQLKVLFGNWEMSLFPPSKKKKMFSKNMRKWRENWRLMSFANQSEDYSWYSHAVWYFFSLYSMALQYFSTMCSKPVFWQGCLWRCDSASVRLPVLCWTPVTLHSTVLSAWGYPPWLHHSTERWLRAMAGIYTGTMAGLGWAITTTAV